MTSDAVHSAQAARHLALAFNLCLLAGVSGRSHLLGDSGLQVIRRTQRKRCLPSKVSAEVICGFVAHAETSTLDSRWTRTDSTYYSHCTGSFLSVYLSLTETLAQADFRNS